MHANGISEKRYRSSVGESSLLGKELVGGAGFV